SFTQRVSMLWAVHASTLLSTNGPQHTPTALFRMIINNFQDSLSAVGCTALKINAVTHESKDDPNRD
ncbi:MAG: hypothetical protein CVV06_19825, partial [Gammaproteobacteria bacterium HGW-Gammaproteobacteria-10]